MAKKGAAYIDGDGTIQHEDFTPHTPKKEWRRRNRKFRTASRNIREGVAAGESFSEAACRYIGWYAMDHLEWTMGDEGLEVVVNTNLDGFIAQLVWHVLEEQSTNPAQPDPLRTPEPDYRSPGHPARH